MDRERTADEKLRAELYQAMVTLQHRCGYIINFCKTEKEMRLEAEAMLGVLKSLTLPAQGCESESRNG